MKNFLLSALLIFVCFSLSGQKLKDQKHNYSFLQLPKSPLKGEFKSYSVRIDPGTMSLASMGLIRSQMAKSFFSLNAYELKPTEGDFEILVTFDGDFLVSKEVKSKKTTQGKGDDAKTITTYHYEVKYRVPITYQISDGKRIVMVERIYSSYDHNYKKNFGSEKYSKNLIQKWEDSGDATLNKWVKAEMNRLLNGLGNHLRSNYDTRMSSRQVPFYTIKKAEKIGYEDMAARMSEVGPIVQSAAADKVLTLDDFGDLIDEWKAVIQSADPEDKKESVAFQAAAYNLAMANMCTGNYGDAATFADQLTIPSKRRYLKKYARQLIDDLSERFRANQNIEYTYHPTFDAESAAANTAPLSASSSAADEGHVGYIMLHEKPDSIDGFIFYDYQRKGTVNSTSLTLKGIRIENTARQPSSRYFKIEEVSTVMDNDQLMIPVDVGVGPIGITTIQRVVHMVDGLWLTQNNYNGDNGYCLLRIVLNKKGEPKRKTYVLNGGLAFVNINTGLKNKFEDCPKIVAKAEASGYAKTETSFLEILEDYDGCEPDLD